MRLVFLGPPGAGKGTIAALLQQRLQVRHISSGDLLREAVRQKDPMAEKAKGFMEQGLLVPDELVTQLILEHLEGLGRNGSFVLDGFPRTVEQAQALDEDLKSHRHAPLDLAVDLTVSLKTVIRRLSGRRVCGSCGAIYHVKTLPPKQSGRCDRCPGTLKIRPDDRPATIRKRLKVYQKQAAPLKAFYRGQGKLKSFSAEKGMEEQYQALVKLLTQGGLKAR